MDFYKIYTSDNNSNICFQCDEIDYDMSLRILYGKVDNSNRIFQFSYYGGKNFTDILRPYGFVYLISSKLQRILDDNEISGFKTHTLEIGQIIIQIKKYMAGMDLIYLWHLTIYHY